MAHDCVFDFAMQYAPMVLGLSAALNQCPGEEYEDFKSRIGDHVLYPTKQLARATQRVSFHTDCGTIAFLFQYSDDAELTWIQLDDKDGEDAEARLRLKRLACAAVKADPDEMQDPRPLCGIPARYAIVVYAITARRAWNK